MLRFALPFLLLSSMACSSDKGTWSLDGRPSAPTGNDSGYTVEGLRKWSLIGNDLDAGHDHVSLSVTAPSGTGEIAVWIDDQPGALLTRDGERFTLDLDISALEPGTHEILLAADRSPQAFHLHRLERSHPLYVVVTTDWDDADTSDLALALQDELHESHSELKLTHFVGPYTFTDSTLDAERVQLLVDWVTGQRDTYGDEIGLHIHPYCNFVTQVDEILGVDAIECHSMPSVARSVDATGYSVRLSSYSEEELTNMFLAADSLFEEAGFGKPTSFRAGGWTAELNVMRALAAAGYVADTSANNWARMEEWIPSNPLDASTLYEWNMEHWAPINDTSQPYYPSVDDILMTGEEVIPVLEVPDNGILVDYVTSAEMIEIFEMNWDGSPLLVPTNYSIGFHPSNFNETYKERMDEALSHVDRFLASDDRGPVVYGRLSDMPKVWKLPE